MSYDFTTVTHGKWILAGEHAVVRGHPALVFPIMDKLLTLKYQSNNLGIGAKFKGELGEDIHLLFWSVLEYGLEIVHRSITQLNGEFLINNNIPIGAGLGASAALCTALSRWFYWQEWIVEQEIYKFAKQLENLFHANSSGVDIAGSMATQGIFFTNGIQQPFECHWQPHWYLSFSNQIGITSHCIKRVQELWLQDPDLAKKIDTNMRDSVQTASAALNMPKQQGLPLLVAAIKLARDCFSQWGLARGSIEQHIEHLLNNGALAAKPTGSGDGGFVLSLWENKPDITDLSLKLIEL